MHRNLLVFFLVLAISSCQKTPSGEVAKLMANLEDMEGNPVKNIEFGDEKLLVHFWATWCKPCLEELPALVRAQETLQKNKFRILLVTEESAEEAITYLNKKGIPLETFRYKGAIADLKIIALPTTLIFNEKGEKVLNKSGQIDWDSELEIQQILNLH